jgi:hypothetical protein
MEAPKKPYWLKARDLLIPAVCALAAGACLALIPWMDGEDLPLDAPYLVAFMGFTFLLVGAASVYFRYRSSRGWKYGTYKGVAAMVRPNGYDPISAINVAAVIHDALQAWVPVYGGRTIEKLASESVFWVTFEAAPLNHNGRMVEGYVYHHTRDIVVGYRGAHQPVEDTALMHEVGHIVAGEVSGDWHEGRHHAVSQAYGIK